MSAQDLAGKVGTALASIGSFIVAQVQNDIFISELVRLLSSCTIAGLGAFIGYYITKWLKDRDNRNKGQGTPPNLNPGSIKSN